MLYICIADVYIFFSIFHIYNSVLASRRVAVSDDSPKLWLRHTSSEISSCQRRKFHWIIGRIFNFPLKAAKQAAAAAMTDTTVLQHYAKIFEQCELEVKHLHLHSCGPLLISYHVCTCVFISMLYRMAIGSSYFLKDAYYWK